MVKLHDPISEACERADGQRVRGKDDLREVLREYGFDKMVKRPGFRLVDKRVLKRKSPQQRAKQ